MDQEDLSAAAVVVQAGNQVVVGTAGDAGGPGCATHVEVAAGGAWSSESNSATAPVIARRAHRTRVVGEPIKRRCVLPAALCIRRHALGRVGGPGARKANVGDVLRNRTPLDGGVLLAGKQNLRHDRRSGQNVGVPLQLGSGASLKNAEPLIPSGPMTAPIT